MLKYLFLMIHKSHVLKNCFLIKFNVRAPIAVHVKVLNATNAVSFLNKKHQDTKHQEVFVHN